MGTENLISFRKKFQLENLTIHTNKNWVLSVRPGQLTLGSLVVSSSTETLNFTDLTPEAGIDLTKILAIAEESLKSVFGAVRINVICLMMQDPLLHFHIIPRYSKNIIYNNIQWEDADWPGPPLFKPVTTSEEILLSLKSDLSEFISRKDLQ